MKQTRRYEIIVHKNGEFYCALISRTKNKSTRRFNTLIGTTTKEQARILEDDEYIENSTIYDFVMIPEDEETEKDFEPKDIKWFARV